MRKNPLKLILSYKHIKYIYLLFILLNILFPGINTNYLILNFSSINYSKNNTYDFMSIIFNNEIYSNLSVGTPSQTLRMILNGNEQTFYITEKTYNSSLSSTYKGERTRGIFFLDNIQQGLKSNDTLYFNVKLKNENIINKTCLVYALVYSIKNDVHKKIDGSIGLQLKVPYYIGVPNFIDSLKSERFINSYQWAILYNNIHINNNEDKEIWNQLLYKDSVGQLLLGFNQDEYNNVFKVNLEKYEVKSTLAEKDKDKIIWSIFFQDIYLLDTRITRNNIIIIDDEDTKKHLDNKLVEFLTTKDYNIGTKEFQLLINEEFFNYYLDNNICIINKIIYDYAYEKFYYYICDNTTGKFILENKFPNIIFFHRQLNSTFELTYKDLFYTDINDNTKNKFYFNIVFSNYARTKWSLGKPFLKKYFFMYDYDKKIIKLLSLKYNNNINNNNNSNYIILIQIIIIAVLVIILFILGILIFRPNSYFRKKIDNYIKKKSSKKKKADELEDEIIPEKGIN